MNAVYSLSIAAAILLLIALANYANLNLGMAGYSEKFIHVSRVCGSTNRGVMQYFLSENALLVLTSLVFSFILSVAANRLVQHQYGLDLMADKARIIALVSLSLFLLGMVAGNFPVMRHLSVDYTGLKNKFSTFSGRGKVISRGIIVLQYTISIALIVSVIVVGRQTRYALESGLGAAGNLICFEDVHTDIQAKFELFKAELLRNSSVESVSAMMDPPGGEANDMFMFSMEGYIPDPDNPMDSYIGILPCDYSFADLFHLRFMAGRSFSPVSNDHETSGEYIINASAMRRLHYTDPQQIVGKAFALNTQMQDVVLPTGKIIGVVEDFHLSNLKKKVEPLVLFKMRNLWLINFMVSPREGMEDKAITDIRNVWTRLFPEYPFEYSYVGAMYRSVYKTELLQARLMSIFTLVALLVCAMGMLGLTLMTLQRKVKEIGIRKIHGAGISDIVIMLNRDLVRWVLLSFVLSIPAAFWFMTRWLGNFAYKTSLDWWIFVLAGSIALVITLLTVSVRSYRAANRNPVEALRYE
jgi:putative ABC transport system permease protein